jgi:hypothetical protein
VENHNFTADFMYDQERSALFQRDMGATDSDHVWWKTMSPPFWYAVGKAGIDVHCYWFATCHVIFILFTTFTHEYQLQKAHVDLIVQVPQDRRHSFNR